ncbi:MAG: hypothetical protein FWH27_15000 [Planctomycetaceae bacterium]|nr:hypothetical protein [Planctomycetaceae bacterium]
MRFELCTLHSALCILHSALIAGLFSRWKWGIKEAMVVMCATSATTGSTDAQT